MRVYFLALGTLLVVCVGCAYDGQSLLQKHEYQAPPAAMLAHPGPMVTGPGPGVLAMGPGAVGMGVPGPAAVRSTQVRFLGPEGMSIGWQIGPGFAENQLMAPGRYNFLQGHTYRLKLSNVPGREALGTLYPSLHVYPAHPTTDAYLAHNALPLRLTDEDLDQVETNNFVTKVIYLPDAKYQELAVAGVEELVSTRLGPGLDPVAEADRRGTIMAVLRVGNMDLEMPGPDGKIQRTSHIVQVDGEQGQFQPPMPIGPYTAGGTAVPSDMMMGGPAGPGQPPYDPVLGASGAQMWGQPYTGTPIGLVGPPHLPLGGPAGLKSHTIRNFTDVDVGEPVDHMLIDVKHEPGIRLPHPVRHVQYTETHPLYDAGELSHPYWAQPGNAGAAGEYVPPGPATQQ
jgi:hypothetical protein